MCSVFLRLSLVPLGSEVATWYTSLILSFITLLRTNRDICKKKHFVYLKVKFLRYLLVKVVKWYFLPKEKLLTLYAIAKCFSQRSKMYNRG